MPKTARATSLRPAPTKPAKATISPLRTSKEISTKTPSRVSLSDPQDYLSGVGVVSFPALDHVAADHGPHEVIGGEALEPDARARVGRPA